MYLNNVILIKTMYVNNVLKLINMNNVGLKQCYFN